MATPMERELVIRLIFITLEGIRASYENAIDPIEKEAMAEKYQIAFDKLMEQHVKFAHSE